MITPLLYVNAVLALAGSKSGSLVGCGITEVLVITKPLATRRLK